MRYGPWTAQHTIHSDAATVGTFTNMPSAATFLFSSTRHITMVDVSGMTYVRLKVNKQATAASSGSKLILRYSPTFSTNVANYVDIGVSEVSVSVDATNTLLVTEWIEIEPTALGHGDICLAVIGTGGNGTLDPQFGSISASFS
jgi:hypothetical protein